MVGPRHWCWLVAAALLGSCGTAGPRVAPRVFEADLIEVAREHRGGAHTYADVASGGRPAPRGIVPDDDGRLWIWSRRHPEQTALAQRSDGRWQIEARRTGPLGTRACVLGDGELARTTVCVGEHQPGGLVAFGPDLGHVALPDRGGFRDVALDGERGLVHVVDGVHHAIWTLDRDGAVAAELPVPAGPLHVGRLGSDRLWLASSAPIRLSVVALDEAGLPARIVASHPRSSLPRSGLWDPESGLLWLVGPEDRPVTRAAGPIRRLRSHLTAHRPEALAAGDPTPVVDVDLGAAGLVDADHLARVPGGLAISAGGSDRVALVAPRGPGAAVRGSVLAGVRPQGLALIHGPGGPRLAVAATLSDDVRWFTPDLAPLGVTELSADAPPEDLEHLGERLFYGTGLWEIAAGDAYTCHSCHVDTRTDHRLQPGFEEVRHEITRPLGGIGAVKPLFSTGRGVSLGDAVEGLVRALDDRFWHGAFGSGAWWNTPRTLRDADGGPGLVLTARRVREALVAFLAGLSVPPPPLRRPGAPLSDEASDGWALFRRDCAGCHAPMRDMRDDRAVPLDAVPGALQTGPLTFARPGWARTGAAPLYTRDGNRITPLRDLGRGGPFFTDGSAPTLDEVLRRARPGTRFVHSGRAGEPSRYDDAERRALRAFLLSI